MISRDEVGDKVTQLFHKGKSHPPWPVAGWLSDGDPAASARSGFPDSYIDLSPAAYKAKCRAIDYSVLEIEADELAGRLFKGKGGVYQIDDAGNGSYFNVGEGLFPQTQVLMSWGWEGSTLGSDLVMVLNKGAMRKVYTDDTIYIWGECLGGISYQTPTGHNTVPLIWAKYFEKL